MNVYAARFRGGKVEIRIFILPTHAFGWRSECDYLKLMLSLYDDVYLVKWDGYGNGDDDDDDECVCV